MTPADTQLLAEIHDAVLEIPENRWPEIADLLEGAAFAVSDEEVRQHLQGTVENLRKTGTIWQNGWDDKEIERKNLHDPQTAFEFAMMHTHDSLTRFPKEKTPMTLVDITKTHRELPGPPKDSS